MVHEKDYLSRVQAIFAGPNPFKPENIPVKTQWDVEQYFKMLRLQKKDINEKEKVNLPAVGNRKEYKYQAPFWFHMFNTKEQMEIRAMVMAYINNGREAEIKLVKKFKLTHERSCEIFHYFAQVA
jgi:ABC-type oligopeptide transport system ATPase subunit